MTRLIEAYRTARALAWISRLIAHGWWRHGPNLLPDPEQAERGRW